MLGVLVFAGVMGGMFWTLFALATMPMDLIEATFAQLGGWVSATLPDGAGARSRRRRHHRRHRRHGGVPAADLPAVLPDQPARGHRLSRARGVRDGSAAVPLRPAGPRVRAAALEPRVRAAGHHVDAADSRSARSAGDDSRRAAHELLGAPAGLRAADQHAVRRPAALRGGWRSPGCYLLGALAALVSAFVIRRTLVKGTARPMVLELPTYKVPSLINALLAAQGSGLRVPEDRRHGHHGDLRRDVVAERLSEGRAAAAGRGAARARPPRRPHRQRRAALAERGRRARRRGRSSRAASPAGSAGSRSRCSRRSATTGSSRSACSRASSRARCSSRRCRCCSAGRTIRISPIAA